MNRRSKLLLGAMLIIGVGLLGDQAYRRLWEEPARRHERQLAVLDKKIATAADLISEASASAERLPALEHCSLPYNEELARARYQDWLLELVNDAELRQASVDSSDPIPVAVKDRETKKPKEIYKRYPFSIRGRGSLARITQFLYGFYQGSHLQKIRSLNLVPGAGGKQLDMTISIEAIGLTRCEREEALSTADVQRLAFADLDAYRDIVQRDIFSRDVASVLNQVILTAVTFDKQGRPEAWFSLGGEQPAKKVLRGESLPVPAHRIEVIDIHPQMVLIQVDGVIVRQALGKSVSEATAAAS